MIKMDDNAKSSSGTFKIGNILFFATPVSIMLCRIGTGWNGNGKEFNTFTSQLYPFLFAQDCEEPLETFCDKTRDKIEQIINEHKLEKLRGFEQTLYSKLAYTRYVNEDSKEYIKIVQNWLESPIGKCGAKATSQLTDWGIAPPYRGLSAISRFGANTNGMYFDSIKAVFVQLDIIAKKEIPEAQFLLTLLHEEIHAAIHNNMGEDRNRKELTWLDELAAILTSHAALRASADTLNSNDAAKLNKALDLHLSWVSYGDLAKTVHTDTGNALVALNIWKDIFKLPAEDRRNYARPDIIKPIAQKHGLML